MIDTNSTSGTPPQQRSFQSQRRWKICLLLILGTLFLWSLFNFRHEFSLTAIARQESVLRDYQTQHTVACYVVAFILYAIVTGASFPGAVALTLICGWLFGITAGVILVSFASTTGATLAFLMSRFFFRDFVTTKFGKSLEKFEQALQKEGAFYLFSLRLIPAVPFFVINLVMGLTPIRTRTFWWVSQLGMLPGTIVYVYAGSNVPTIGELAENGLSGIMTAQLWLAFGILAIFPYLVRRIMATLSKR